jgi:hypothetical protein
VRAAGLATLAAGLAVLLAACGSSHPAASVTTPPATHPSPAPTTPRTVPPSTAPPTTRWAPTAAQASPDAAAAQLVAAWATGNRAMAETVASPGAVAALFAVPYPGAGLAIPRGCSAGFPPIVCTYGPPGGADPTDPVFEISLAQDSAGWYVSSVRTLH